MLDAAAVGNEFIRPAEDDGCAITPMQVIKLTYIAHGWHLAMTGQPLLSDQVQAWKFGPVLPELYHALKIHGRGPVGQPIWPAGSLDDAEGGPQQQRTIRQIIERVWDVYGRQSGWQLSELTHGEGTPWSLVWSGEGHDAMRVLPISNDSIKEHYTRILERNRETAA